MTYPITVMNASSSPAAVWQQHARRTLRRFQLAWWLQSFAPWAAGLALLISGVVLILRSRGIDLPLQEIAGGLAAGYVVMAVLAWQMARRHFLKQSDGMVLLESRLGLHNALTAASAGITAWPAPPPQVDDGFRFRASWLVAPALLTVTCLTLAFVLPVSRAETQPVMPPPLALNRAEEILKALEKEGVVDPAALEQARGQLEALLKQSPEDYYTHHSLEAADTLETSLREAAGSLGSKLQTAAQAAESLEKYDTSLTPSARQQLESELKAAVEGIRNSSMGPSEALKKQLEQLDPSKLKEIDPEQLKKMMENLKAKSAACKECQGKGQGESESEAGQALSDLLNGNSKQKNGRESGEEGEENEGKGQGGINRGPGTADLTYEKNANDLATQRLEQLENADLSRTLPGDHLGTKDIEHHLDKSATTPSAGGGVASPAQGGDAVWRDQLVPSEQKVLRQYFK